MKQVEESQRNGHYSTEEHVQTRPNKNNQNRRDRGSNSNQNSSSGTGNNRGGVVGGTENHETHENNLPPRLRGQKDQQPHPEHNNTGGQRSDRGGRNKGGGNKRGQQTHQGQ